jgi:hypothetical protein
LLAPAVQHFMLRCARHKPARSRFDGDDAFDLYRNLVRQHHIADR